MPQTKIDLYIYLVFIAIAIVVAVILLFAVFLIQKNKLVNEKLKTQLEFQKKLYQSELSALRGQLNPHFIHNSINAIQYYIQRNEVSLSENYLSKLSKLLRLFFEYSRKQTISLADEINLLNNYLEIEKMRFEDKLNYTIHVDKSLDEEDIFLPSMILQPIVENAVNHGVFHKKGNGTVTISFLEQNNNMLAITVEDDGVGIDQVLQFQKNNRKDMRVSSSQVLKERLLMLKESKLWDIEYNIIDKAEITSSTGTLVTLFIKNLVV
ncbi:MAG: histidine kinase [Flavobacteriaceae bacterium]|nr:histidine kinase [Flavobacteriaceae bacterium]